MPLEPVAQQLRSMPILIWNVHSHCNCRCLMCDIWKREEREQVDVAGLERHRQSLRDLGVRQVVLSGGEPLLHNDLEALCRFFGELNIRLTLLTTGLLLRKRAREVATHFDEVIVSIDGPPEVHDAIRRVPGAFALITQGIEAVRAARPGMRVSCRTTVQKANHHRLNDTAHAAMQAGFDTISFLAADLTSSAFNRPLIWPGERQSEIALTQEELCVLESQLDALAAFNVDLNTPFVSESREKLARILRHFRAYLDMTMPAAPTCNAPWVSAVVETDGTVKPCFFHRPIGNVRFATLEEVVNGERGRGFRQSLDVARDPVCRRCVCSLNYRNQLVKVGDRVSASDATSENTPAVPIR